MSVLVDTSILGRLANRADAAHAVAKAAISDLHRRREVLYIAPHNLIEFRNFATRPVAVNGLGLASPAADTLMATFETSFTLLQETPDIYPTWKRIVAALGVVGKQVHDARLVAICHVHTVTHLLTFNVAHFARIAKWGPGLVVLEPSKV
jgi:predicted nucleic acid-binding protein